MIRLPLLTLEKSLNANYTVYMDVCKIFHQHCDIFSQHINQSLPASFRRAWFGVETPEGFQENGWAQLKKREHQTKSWRSYRVTTHPTTKCRHLGVPTFLFGGDVYSNLNF